jgi:hypothetical protein
MRVCSESVRIGLREKYIFRHHISDLMREDGNYRPNQTINDEIIYAQKKIFKFFYDKVRSEAENGIEHKRN